MVKKQQMRWSDSGAHNLQIARHLAAQGAKVALGARRQGHLDKIVSEIVAAGGQAFALAVDVTKRDEVEAFVEAAVKKYGRLDVFINNAGADATIAAGSQQSRRMGTNGRCEYQGRALWNRRSAAALPDSEERPFG
jgi:NADP-dependent 3-hydroxy acid dehydrogenase YdfG